MEYCRRTLLRGSILALLVAGSLSALAQAMEETASTGPGFADDSAFSAEEEAPPMRNVLNSFSQTLNDFYSSLSPQLQKLYNMNLPYLPYGGASLKVPVMNGGSQYNVPNAVPQLPVVPGGASGNSGLLQFPTVPSQRLPGLSKPTSSGTGTTTSENADVQAALVTALTTFHQYVDSFINHLSAKFSPYFLNYTPPAYVPVYPTPLPPYPVPMPTIAPAGPGYVVPPLTRVCAPGDIHCGTLQADAPETNVPTVIASPPPAPDVDMSAIIELLGRFGGKLSPTHIVTLQPFMEQYLAKLSSSSKAALKPLLFQYWPQLYPSAPERPKQTATKPESAGPSASEPAGRAD